MIRNIFRTYREASGRSADLRLFAELCARASNDDSSRATRCRRAGGRRFGSPAVHLGSRVVSQFEQVASGKSVGHDVDSADANAGDVASATGAETEIDPDPERKRNPSNVLLLFVFVLLTQISDFSQFAWSLIFPQHKIAPHVNSNRSYEGVALGVLTTAFFAIAMWRFTPFDSWEKAAVAGLVISIMGFAGNITVSAIKRDQGVGDFETLIEGHNGILDRIDSLCFAAPVFFHYIRILS